MYCKRERPLANYRNDPWKCSLQRKEQRRLAKEWGIVRNQCKLPLKKKTKIWDEDTTLRAATKSP